MSDSVNAPASLHPDLVEAHRILVRGMVSQVLAGAFMEAHRSRGTTFADVAVKLGVEPEQVRAMLECSGALEEVSDMALAMGLQIKMVLEEGPDRPGSGEEMPSPAV